MAIRREREIIIWLVIIHFLLLFRLFGVKYVMIEHRMFDANTFSIAKEINDENDT